MKFAGFYQKSSNFALRLDRKIRNNWILANLNKNSTRQQVFLFYSILFFSISNITTYSQGFGFQAQDLYWFPVQFVLIFILTRLLPNEVSGPIDVLQVFSAVFLSIPSVVIAFANETHIELKHSVEAMVYCLFFQFIVSKMSSKFVPQTFRFAKGALTLNQMFFLLCLVTLTIYVAIFTLAKVDLGLISFTNIYEKREELLTVIGASNNALVPYLYGWFGGVLLPLILLLALVVRKRLLIICSVGFIFLAYVTTAQKWILASMFLVFFLFFISSKNINGRILTSNIFYYFNILLCAAIFAQATLTFLPWTDLVIRRSLLDPSIMVQYYVKFTDYYPAQWWADSKLRTIFVDSQAEPVSQIIGDRFFNDPPLHFLPNSGQTNATAGSLADSIAQGRFLGFLLISVCVFAFFWVMQCLTLGKNFRIVFVLSALVTEMLVEGTLHTSLTSRGMILVPIILLLLRQKDKVL